MTVIDDAAFANLLAMAGDDAAFIGEVIDTYLSDAPQQLQTMRGAVGSGDAELLRRAAHTLKSTSQNLGAVSLGSVAADIERLARDGQLGGVQERLAAADHGLVAVAAELRHRQRELGARP